MSISVFLIIFLECGGVLAVAAVIACSLHHVLESLCSPNQVETFLDTLRDYRFGSVGRLANPERGPNGAMPES